MPVTGINHNMLRHGLPVAIALLPYLLGAGDPGVAPPGASLLGSLPPRWRDDNGHELWLADLRGRRVIMTMAYASCRKICPISFLRLKEMQSELDSRGETAEFVIVGYDPGDDDTGAWHQYRETRKLTRTNWHFITGTNDDTERLARLLGFEFWKYDDHVMHDFRIVIFDAGGELHASLDSSRA
ncbi:MAG: SCO family protein, partial [Burkholderiales bacterium]